MRRSHTLPFLTLLPILLIFSSCTFAEWKAVDNAMLTQWGEKVRPNNVWREYPRPQMKREKWTNLNGLWSYAITKKEDAQPKQWSKQILVPFALETPLSGVGQRLGLDEVIWYQRTFVAEKTNDRTLLNFEGVDYYSQVWVNGQKVGEHKGGNLPFSFDITSAVKAGNNELVMRVLDDTDTLGTYQLRGKQKRDNGGIWYTPSSGIWQTVWLESVPNTYIQGLEFEADMHGTLRLEAKYWGDLKKESRLSVRILEDGKTLKRAERRGTQLELAFPEAQLWSPQSPKLYDLVVELKTPEGKLIDRVGSYAGFRTIEKKKDAKGHWRFALNGQIQFHLGPLDQGWWPDGFLNPPSDEAIVFEMDYLKKAGYNMIRKHKKVEPRRYYYHADRIGFLIWQDQVSGGGGIEEWPMWKKLFMNKEGFKPDLDAYSDWEKIHVWKDEREPLNTSWPQWAHEQYMRELKTMIDTLHNHPSIVVWTTFNEAWGQHRTMEVGKWTKAYDPSRLLNVASGGNFFEVGDIADEHAYPEPAFPVDVPLYDDYIKVVGEFGGHGWSVDGHQWKATDNNWGYGGLPKTIEEYRKRYENSIRTLSQLREQGIAGGIYTQTTDVEIELNGLMTYDRAYIKFPADELSKIHRAYGFK